MTRTADYDIKCARCKYEFKIEYLKNNIICPQCNALLGYHSDGSDKMLMQGQIFILPKGVKYHSMHYGWKTAKKTSRKKLHHMLNGAVEYAGMEIKIISNPEVRWVGSGSYWCSADINDIIIL